MPWCEKCFKEYENGTAECPDCGATLVGQLDISDKNWSRVEEGLPIRNKHILEPTEEVFLVRVSDQTALSYIVSILEQESIGYRIFRENIGKFTDIAYGRCFAAADIYVDGARLDEAKEIAASLNAVDTVQEDVSPHTMEQEEPDDIGWPQETETAPQFANRMLLKAFMVIGIGIVALSALIYILLLVLNIFI